jgi:hypothetical protein
VLGGEGAGWGREEKGRAAGNGGQPFRNMGSV